ncbi:hypothetical protein UFOVP1247_8 [uncultured Caudovirales phage]|jgi:hypothetical protein|uniref:Uncharacterized protein n=1 Tax=uncultured Caudovirales phage TaxID=2100421 RepID=A0A6J5PS46_9CAUD|nr:hypothetical protein UFOVP970_48 [uncultured Caudovirales phage]CAB4193031.1 hypothetical protein UFOVP1247_8 [uncultured Caudovirales phage]
MKILRPEVNACIHSDGGIHDMFDNVIKVLFNITDDEYDFIAECANDEELNVFLTALGNMEKGSSFTERRKALELRNEMLTKFNLTSVKHDDPNTQK